MKIARNKLDITKKWNPTDGKNFYLLTLKINSKVMLGIVVCFLFLL